MIYLTGDIHRKIDDRFTKPIAKKLGKNDYLIVLGDFGVVWYDDASDNLFLSYFEKDRKNSVCLKILPLAANESSSYNLV